MAKQFNERSVGLLNWTQYPSDVIALVVLWRLRCKLYRAIDRDGALVDVMLSKHREPSAAKAFFRSAKAVTGVTPGRVTNAADPR